MYRSLLVIKISVLLIIFTVAISGCENMQAGEQVSETRLLLDTFCTITIHGAADDIDKLTDVMGRAFDICLEYEKLFSITIEGSDVWQINHAGGEPAAVSSQTIEVMRAGIEFGELSGGMFDITLGRLSRLWDFGGNKSVPDKAEIDAAQATVNYRQVNINGNFVHLENPDAWIDLGAIAKGYIADKIALYLAEQGVTSALIDLGGDIVTIGSRGDDKPWRLGIRAPFGSADEYIGVIEIVGASVVSSGIYERGFDESGVWYHHILDPGTGMPVISDIVSATVVADNAIIGEGLSTIVILAGSREAAALFERVPGFIGAVLVLENGEVQIFGDVRFAG